MADNETIQTLIAETMQTLRGFIMTQGEQVETIKNKVSKLDAIAEDIQELKEGQKNLEKCNIELGNRMTVMEESKRFYEQFFAKLEERDKELHTDTKTVNEKLTEMAIKYAGLAALLGLLIDKILLLIK